MFERQIIKFVSISSVYLFSSDFEFVFSCPSPTFDGHFVFWATIVIFFRFSIVNRLLFVFACTWLANVILQYWFNKPIKHETFVHICFNGDTGNNALINEGQASDPIDEILLPFRCYCTRKGVSFLTFFLVILEEIKALIIYKKKLIYWILKLVIK